MKEQNALVVLDFCAWLSILFFIGYLAYLILGILFSLDMLEKITPWFIERNREIRGLLGR